MPGKTISSLNVVLGATTAPFLKAFSGAGKMASGLAGQIRGVGSSILSLGGLGGVLAGVLTVSMGFKGLAMEQEAIANLGAVMKATGNQTGMTTQELLDFAWAERGISAIDDDFIVQAMAKIGTFVNITGENFKLATRAAEDLSTVMQGDLQGAAIQVGKALNDPIRGVSALRRVGVSFTQSQLAAIKALQNTGDMAGAQKIVLDELAKEFGGAAEAAGKTFPKQFLRAKWAIGEVIEEMIRGFLPILVKTANVVRVFAENLGKWFNGMAPKVTAFTEWVTTGFSNLITFLTPYASAFVGIVLGAFKQVYDFAVPIFNAVVSFISDNWRSALTTTVAYWGAVYAFFSAVLGAVWDVVVIVGQAIGALWRAAMDALGMESVTAGQAIGESFQGIVDACKWLEEKITLVLNVTAFTIKHWQEAFQIAGLAVALYMTRLGNEVEYVLTEVIPTILVWFMDNWKDVFQTMFDYTFSVFKNISANVIAVMSNLPGLIAGTTSFSELWIPLTDGFESSIKSLPEIAARQAGPLEQGLQKELDGMTGTFSTGLDQYIKDQKAAADKATSNITDFVGGVFGAFNNKMPTVEVPALPDATMKVNGDTSGVIASAKKAKSDLGIIFSGSAESQLMRFQGGLQSMKPVAGALAGAAKNGAQDNMTADAVKKNNKLTEQGNDTLDDISDKLDDAGIDIEEAII